jgi:hypothetical protein
VVSNEGLDDDPGPITLTDELPPFLEFVDVAGSGWTCEHDAGVVTCVWNGPLGAGASAPPIVITTMIGSTLTDELVTNMARVSSALADSTPDNDTDTALVEIVVAPDDPPVDSTLPATGVPHEGTTKYALLLVALGAALLLASRRRLGGAP